MTSSFLIFDAVAEHLPGQRAQPERAQCEAALAECMPELVSVHRKLARLSGDGDRAARFLSTWCLPPHPATEAANSETMRPQLK
jgi:hypothetical protein